jgi:hypothetical protein
VQPNPRMRFGDAADRWLAEQVAALRPATNAIYRNAVVNHLRPRWGTRRMDAIGEAGPVERMVVGQHDTPSFAWADHGQIMSTARWEDGETPMRACSSTGGRAGVKRLLDRIPH